MNEIKKIKNPDLELQKNDDGYWLVFKDSKKRISLINLGVVFDGSGISHSCIRQWAVDQFDKKDSD